MGNDMKVLKQSIEGEMVGGLFNVFYAIFHFGPPKKESFDKEERQISRRIHHGPRLDRENIYSDWFKVGNQLKDAIENVKEQSDKKEVTTS